MVHVHQVAAKSPAAVKGLVLLNCAVGMNSKAAVDDWRIVLLYPILVLIDLLLKVASLSLISGLIRKGCLIVFNHLDVECSCSVAFRQVQNKGEHKEYSKQGQSLSRRTNGPIQADEAAGAVWTSMLFCTHTFGSGLLQPGVG
jgi:hypothetical protein